RTHQQVGIFNRQYRFYHLPRTAKDQTSRVRHASCHRKHSRNHHTRYLHQSNHYRENGICRKRRRRRRNSVCFAKETISVRNAECAPKFLRTLTKVRECCFLFHDVHKRKSPELLRDFLIKTVNRDISCLCHRRDQTAMRSGACLRAGCGLHHFLKEGGKRSSIRRCCTSRRDLQ